MTEQEATTTTVPEGLLESTRKFLAETHQLVIGDGVDTRSEELLDIVDPATGQLAARVVQGNAEDAGIAVGVARRAFNQWSAQAPQARERALSLLADSLESNLREIAEIEMVDTGKPLRNALAEVTLAINVFRYYAGWPTKASGEVNPTGGRLLSYTVREPLGVCAQITAWNYPFLLAAWKVAPAIAFGNSVVLKPPELAPLSSMRLGQLALESGLPPGVLNVVPGLGTDAGAALVDHRDVDKIAFTGSTAVGRHIAASAAPSMKRLTLELGGKSPSIVFADADFDAAVNGAIRGIFWNSGQVCVAGSRLIVHESIAVEFVQAVVAKAQALRIGRGLESGVDMGPLISSEHRAKVMSFVAAGLEDGANLVTGGREIAGDGYFMEPTIFAGVNPTMRIATDEIFGPVLSVMTFKDDAEAIRLGNDTEFGLAAAVWTRDIARAHLVARALRAGTVWLNTFGVMEPSASFGGFKQSGIGRELGSHSIDAYTEVKSVYASLR